MLEQNPREKPYNFGLGTDFFGKGLKSTVREVKS
jgi:hypothetical protein